VSREAVQSGDAGKKVRPADWKSAIRQTGSLRYVPTGGRRYGRLEICATGR